MGYKEMYKRRLILLVYEPRRFIYVVNRLRKRGVSFSIPDSLDDVSQGDIVYTDDHRVASLLKSNGALVFLDEKGDDTILEKAVLSMNGKKEYNELSIGIDPGDRFVIVALADGSIVDYSISYSIDDAVKYVSRVLTVFPARKKLVKIGGGVGGIVFLEKLKRVVGNSKIIMMVVDEDNSTPKTGWRNPFIERIISSIPNSTPYRKDLYAATVIALKQGIVVEDGDED